jgi:hypothetical protein
MKNFFLKIWNTPFLHALFMTVEGAIVGAVYPFVMAWIDNQPIPTLHVILMTALKAAVGAVMMYLLKKGFLKETPANGPDGQTK